jgi:hypothetical protein
MVESISRAPSVSVPSGTQVSARQSAEFEALKKSLGHIGSWELIGNSWDKLSMAFTESGNENQARILLSILE